nr:hypothetical protein [Tanacetum cinerariifolium]
PPQKKCAFQMSAPEDDSFEIDDALAEPKALESTRYTRPKCALALLLRRFNHCRDDVRAMRYNANLPRDLGVVNPFAIFGAIFVALLCSTESCLRGTL